MTYKEALRHMMVKRADGWGYKPQPSTVNKMPQPGKPVTMPQQATVPKPPVTQPAANKPQSTQNNTQQAPQVRTAPQASQPMPQVQQPRQQTQQAKPIQQPTQQTQPRQSTQNPAQRTYQSGDWTRFMAKAPLPFQVFNPQLYTNADVWNDTGNGLRSGVRGAVKGIHSALSFGMRIPSYLHRAWEYTTNPSNPAYNGMNWKQRWDATKTQTQDSWTASLGRQADRYDDLVEEGMDAVPGMAYTNDFETNYPMAKRLGEWGGGVLSGVATGKALGAVANPASAPQAVQPMLKSMPSAVQAGAKALGHTAGDFVGYAADTLKSAKDMPQWGANVIDAGTNAFGLYNAVTSN